MHIPAVTAPFSHDKDLAAATRSFSGLFVFFTVELLTVSFLLGTLQQLWAWFGEPETWHIEGLKEHHAVR